MMVLMLVSLLVSSLGETVVASSPENNAPTQFADDSGPMPPKP